MIPRRRRKRSPRFVEIANEAGVSPSTVDRVLNERGSVSEEARRKVIHAAQKLAVPRILPSAAHELIHIDVLLPDNRTPFFLRLRGTLAGACSILDKRIVVHRRIVREADESLLIKNIVSPNYRRRGLMIAAPDTEQVRSALRVVLDRGEAVVTVVSNVADVPGIAYFGIDNYRAGRTAGLVMGRFARHPGRVIFLSGGNDWSVHLERTAGCRDALTGASPHLVCDDSQFETLDDEIRCALAVAEALRSTGLAGVYNSGAGSAGIMRALEQFDPQHRVTWITHELSDDHRQYLSAGALAMVIDQDPDMQAFKALRYLVERAVSNTGHASVTPGCEFHLYFSENIQEGLYLPMLPRSPELRLASDRGTTSAWMR
jgi:LacI family transcriptional regulator